MPLTDEVTRVEAGNRNEVSAHLKRVSRAAVAYQKKKTAADAAYDELEQAIVDASRSGNSRRAVARAAFHSTSRIQQIVAKRKK